MMNYILFTKNKNNNIKYISNTSPLLWTNNKFEAKKFRSKEEINLDLYSHVNILNKMEKELGLKLYLESIES